MYRQRLQALARESGFPVVEFGDPHFTVSQKIIEELRLLPYLGMWQRCIANRWFHVRMADHSIFLFQEGLRPSYSFLHCPLDVIPMAEYIRSLGLQDSPAERRRIADDYAMVMDTSGHREHLTPIRFDYDPKGYKAGVHPVAHIHIGLENDVRLSCNKMNPISFVLFVMRQLYPESWDRLLDRNCCSQYVSHIRALSTRVERDYWSERDQLELFLA